MMKINEVLTLDNQLEKIGALQLHGWRFVTMTVVDNGEMFDIYYHFDLDYELMTYKLELKKGDTLPSISGVCFAAVVVENEIQDLFGITITGLAIDYEKHFLLAPDAPAQPFCRVPGVGVTAVASDGKGNLSDPLQGRKDGEK
jgi:ech hydrogenase subunit D